MKEFRADLHIHSSCSDGTETPSQILDLAILAGLCGLSITDHDTIQAYTPEFWKEAQEKKIELLMGVEISSEWQGLTVHILAYSFDLSLQSFIHQVQERRKERNIRILEKLKKRGIQIDETELSVDSLQIVGRSHIAAAMVKKKAVSSMQEAFEQYLKDDGCCYAPGGKFAPHEVIQAIHESNGFAILAHPHFLKRGHFLREILALSWDGFECYYGVLPKGQEVPWVKMAQDRNLIITGGSDYHGKNRSYLPIGCSWVNEETFLRLRR